MVGLRYPWWRLAFGGAAFVVAAVFAASLGSVDIPFLATAQIVLSRLPGIDSPADTPAAWDTIVWQLRLPRVALAGIVGGGLAMAGAAYQGLFKNPLADPYLVGGRVRSGSGGSYRSADRSAFVHRRVQLPAHRGIHRRRLGGGGGLFRRPERTGNALTTLILAGVAIASLAGAVTSLLMIRSDPELRPVISWLLGSFISSEWSECAIVLAYLAPSMAVLLGFGRVLNVLQLREEHASMLGVEVEKVKLLLIVAATMATAAAVSFTGLIGFVGLIAPHVVRLIWGTDYRFILPMSAILGATFLVLADLAARTVASPGELPVGIVTAFCGAPFFLYLLRRRGAGMV